MRVCFYFTLLINFYRTGFIVFIVVLAAEVGAGVTAETKIKIEIEREIIIFSKKIFFFFGRYSISVSIIGDFTIIIFSASEISVLEVDLICY